MNKLLFFVLMMLSSHVYCQEYSAKVELPQQCPLPPNAASLAKYIDYPVNLYTGIPNISIPLYEIVTKDLRLPISISYHASGIKVTDISSWVGLGWSLNTGGQIHRKVMGIHDDANHGFFDSSCRFNQTYSGLALHTYLDDIYNMREDSQPDIFSFQFSKGSGRFLYLWQNQEPTITPFSSHKIRRHLNPLYFDIIDDTGTCYSFNEKQIGYYSGPDKPSLTAVVTWLPSCIKNSVRTDSITYRYSSQKNYNYGVKYYYDVYTVSDNLSHFNDHPFRKEIVSISTYNDSRYEEHLLSEIAFTNGRIAFYTSSQERQDGVNGYGLDRIIVYNQSGNIEKTIKLHQSYFINENVKRLRLDSLDFIDKRGVVIERYKFSYNETKKLPGVDTKSIDLWGYYNGRINDRLMPQLTIDYDGTPTVIGSTNPDGRKPSSEHMQAYILQKIEYPTGGYSQFKYEANQYAGDNNTTELAGGLRIKKIENFDPVTKKALVKTYMYGLDGNGKGRLNVLLDNFYFHTTRKVWYIDGTIYPTCTKRQRDYFSYALSDINGSDGSPVIYANVTEYMGDTNQNTGKTVFVFSDKIDYQVSYTNISKSFLIDNSHERGLLLNKAVFAKKGINYEKIHETINQYQYFAIPQLANVGLGVVKAEAYLITPQTYYIRDEFTKRNYPHYTGDNLLTSTFEYTYAGEDTIKKKTFYKYNNKQDVQLSEVRKIDSQDNEVKMRYKYPSDTDSNFSDTNPKEIIDILLQRHRTGVVLNESFYKGDQLLHSKINNYAFWQNKKLVELSTVETKSKDQNDSETRIRYHSYDSYGNPACVSYENGPMIIYIWGYKGQYPVAKVETTSKESSYYTTIINAITSSNITILSDTPTDVQVKNIFTNLRSNSALAGALITSYTYKPLVGITSETDPSGRTIFYEYDGFGRLWMVKDEQANIIKDYKYHYQ